MLKIQNLIVTHFFSYISTCLSGDLWFYEIVCGDKMYVFFVQPLRMYEKMCIFAAIFENTLNS